MTRNTAREIAIHLIYELNFTEKTPEELLSERLSEESFAALAEEDELYAAAPDAIQSAYIRRLVTEVAAHTPELDGYIAKYAVGWNFSRIPLVAAAIMRVAMGEILYLPDIPTGVSINEAVEIAKKYETPETVKFINGILGSFVRQEQKERPETETPQAADDARPEDAPEAGKPAAETREAGLPESEVPAAESSVSGSKSSD